MPTSVAESVYGDLRGRFWGIHPRTAPSRIFDVFLAGFTKENATMALDQSALTDLLDALRSGGEMDVFRDAMQLVLQALIDLEATQAIGRRPL